MDTHDQSPNFELTVNPGSLSSHQQPHQSPSSLPPSFDDQTKPIPCEDQENIPLVLSCYFRRTSARFIQVSPVIESWTMALHFLAYLVFSVFVWASLERNEVGLCQNVFLGIVILLNFFLLMVAAKMFKKHLVVSNKRLLIYVALKYFLMVAQVLLLSHSSASFYEEFSVRLESKEQDIASTIVTGYVSGLSLMLVPILHHNIFYNYFLFKAVKEQSLIKQRQDFIIKH